MVDQKRIEHVAEAIESRRSVRAFKPDTVFKASRYFKAINEQD